MRGPVIKDEVKVPVGSFITKTGTLVSQLKTHHSGLLHRPEVVDLLSIQESFLNYKNLIVKDRIVLDAGANIGAFSYFAAKNGAKEIHAFEPEPHTYAMLVENVKNIPDNVSCILYNRALTNSVEEHIPFWVGYGRGGPSTATTEFRRGRNGIVAINENFKKIANEIQPNTIKIDIEGGEYNIVLDIPDSCDELALEWHGSTPDRKRKFKTIYPLFMEKGWQVVFEKKRESFKKHATSKGKEPRWAIDAHYRR
jgi:FkbM family methyltransferase